MRPVAVVILLSISVVAACSEGHQSLPRCSPDGVSVTVAFGVNVTITAKGEQACQLSGDFPVALVSGNHLGAPPNASGRLAPGNAYVQRYSVALAPSCPAPNANSPTTVTVELEGQHFAVEVGSSVAHDIGCVTLRAGRGSIV